MALTQSFYQAVNEKNVRLVRIMMKDSLIVDPSFQQFSEMEKAAEKVMDIYEPHDGRELEEDRDKWTEEYMDKLMVQVISNFSRERIEKLKAVVRKFYPMPQRSQGTAQCTRSGKPNGKRETIGEKETYQERKKRDQKEGNYICSVYATGAVAGAVIGGTVGAVAGMAAAGEVIVGGIAAGAAVGAAAGIGVAASMMGGNKKDE